MKSLRFIALLVVLVLMVSGTVFAVQVDGYCYLENQSNHEGTKVLFVEDSPGAITDSTYTDSTGYYLIELTAGGYYVYFTHDGFCDYEILGQLLFSNTTQQQVTLIEIIGIPISGPLSGVLTGETYRVTGAITVQIGDSLIIEPGATFLFDGFYISFGIYGYLYAVGTETDSIKFMPGPCGLDWRGIEFNNQADDSSILEYCLIKGCNSSGIYCSLSNPTISYCTISANSANDDGGGIYCYANSSPVISHCTISGNTTTHDGGGIYCYNSNPTINHCTISGNLATNVGGGIYWYSNSSLIISHCTINGNSAGGGGGGIFLSSYSLTLVNTIVAGNTGNGGIYFSNSPDASITYGDFYDNEGGNFTGNPPPLLGESITVNYNGDSCDAYFNIFDDPLFYATSGDSAFYLTEDSPCIDAGDPNSSPDPDGTFTDMGAFYFHQYLIVINPWEYNFGEVNVGNNPVQTLWVINNSDTTAVIYGMETSDSTFTTNYSPEDSLLLSGDSLEVAVTFTPYDMIPYSDTLLVFTSVDTLQAVLAGVGIAPLIESVPDSLIYVPLELGMDTSLTIIFQNNGTDTLNISSVAVTDTAFIVDFPTYGNPIPPSESSDTCRVTFDPDYEGLFQDSLIILCNAFNTVNDTFIVNIWGECGIVPDTVRNLVIEVDYPDAVLNWDHVTNTIYGSPLVVDYYLVFFKEVLSETFNFLAVTPDTTYTHAYVTQFSSSMFYMVEGYVGELGGLDEILASGRTLTREEVHGLLDGGN